MIQVVRGVTLLTIFYLSLLSLSACSGESSDTAEVKKTAKAGISAGLGRREGEPMDVIARVGDQSITFNEINTMLNSAAIVGLSMPELGSPERDTVRLTLLDKLITANLLYLDAIQKGVDKEPEYQQTVDSFRDAILVNLYRSKYMVGEIKVSEQDIDDFYKSRIIEGTKLSDELKAGIEATIRKERVNERTSSMRERLREGHKSVIAVSDLDPAEDQVRSDDDTVASLDGTAITWGEVRPALQRATTMTSTQARIEALENTIDNRIMAQKAKDAGLEQDPLFKARYGEFSKTRLINIHRGRLVELWDPSGEEVNAYYETNKDRIIVKEVRKVQMLVVKTEQEADALKQQIEANKINFHKAVADHSIVADAKKTLGQIGWVNEGSGFPELDKETFLLEAGEIGGPVQSPAGWHLVRILDQRDALHTDINNEQTYKNTRRLYLDEKLDQYVINLRKENFPVEIEEEMFSKLSQQEVDWYQEMLAKAQKSPEEVIEEIKRLQKGNKQ
jgi:parvulin-like peptidyl-prolyl isomerase